VIGAESTKLLSAPFVFLTKFRAHLAESKSTPHTANLLPRACARRPDRFLKQESRIVGAEPSADTSHALNDKA